MSEVFKEEGFLIRKKQFSEKKIYLCFFTARFGKINVFTGCGPKRSLDAWDLFSFHELDCVPKSNFYDDYTLNYPQITPNLAFGASFDTYRNYLYGMLWLELVSQFESEPDSEQTRMIYELSEFIRREPPGANKNELTTQSRNLFYFLKYGDLLFDYSSCGNCNRKAFKLLNNTLIFNKISFGFWRENLLICNYCQTSSTPLNSAFVKICHLLDYSPGDATEIPIEFLFTFLTNVLYYLKFIGFRSTVADEYLKACVPNTP